ncbi:aspartyl/asparaginyl beta-hydroxylase isoform X2 [Amyelois transitella]|uniref:aspartyl/asparaginyl beta-hydroxylase isoform X2 n=1 Tax=Amyelois transitella TaxID=680683 RepID=UPI00298FEFBB|nr:aspartyl/asparaginyl beta-hydroxylase isoform X2 [Amyelois transitella]
MSGDVQPRKRKDKKRKKDELGVEEPRGTAATLGEGDVFIHSHHDHGTGGHWCAKIIFFSLLAVLVALIGLIILENRGLTELEANSVESRYSGVLEGWLEDAPEDDHHDEHTLELNHPDDDEDDHGDEQGHDDDDETNNDDDDEDDEHNQSDNEDDDEEEDDEHNYSDDEEKQTNNEDDDENYKHDQNNDDDEEIDEQLDIDSNEENEEKNQERRYGKYYDDEDDEETANDDDDLDEVDDSEDDDNENIQTDSSIEEDQNISNNDLYDKSEEQTNDEDADNEEDEEHDEEEEEDTEVEIERIEKEIDLEPISTELPALPEEEDDDDDKSEEVSTEVEAQEKEDEDDGVAPEDLDEDFLEDDSDEPPIEHITAPVGKPLVEVEEDSSEKPPDTLAEEEEYEKLQQEKKREEEQSSHMWLKLTVGAALLVATHAVIRRATAPREAPTEDDRTEREETPLLDRRMTLIPQEPVTGPKEEVVQRVPTIQQTPPSQEEEDEEEDEEKIEDEEIEVLPSAQDMEDKELYSDEEVEEEEEIEIKKEAPNVSVPKPEEKIVAKSEPEPDPEDDPDDVEIIDDEQLEEEVEEDEDEEDISDVDDAELLSRLEAKYGRLPEPERPGQKHKDGGNSVHDEWPGEPSDAFWRRELDSAERELRQGSWSSAASRASAPELRGSGRARWVAARAADLEAEARRDNKLLGRAIAAYLELLKMNEKLSDKKLKEIAARTIDRIMFRGNYLSAEPVYRVLLRRFPEEVSYRNNLTISLLMANRADLAEEILKETLKKWPNDRVALAHYGFVLKTLRNRLEEAVELFQKALEGDIGPANEPRFYYHLGDALLLLGRPAEAHEVHKRGAKLGHFLSPAQRSLYNVPRLKSRPWWNIDESPYAKLARALEKSWKEILKEGEAAKSLYEKEKEGLKERGDWSQLDLFARGQEIPNRCKNAPVTCSVVRSEPAAVGCRRGQIKFSAMKPGTHVRPHVGPTNCRLRMHLALSNTKDTFIRVDQTVRQWQTGKVFMFDDSFEHEVWHNGTGTRLVLIVDVWHPDLTPQERRSLPAI